MKIISPVVALFAVAIVTFPGFCMASDLSGLDTTLRILQEQIARQIERIQSVREKSDSQVSVARARMENQLKQAQEDLAVQTEILERLREQLQDKMKETDERLVSWREHTTGAITKTMAELSAQMDQTTDLMRRLGRIKSQISDCSGTGNAMVAPSPIQTVPSSSNTSPPILPQSVPSAEVLSPRREAVGFLLPEPTPFMLEAPVPSG